MLRWIRLAGPVTVAIFVAACGATSPPRSQRPVEPAQTGAGYDFRREGKIPPPAGGAAQPETDVEEIAVTDSSLDVTEAEAPRDTLPPPAPAAAAETVDGFRIQIFASADREVAQHARDVAAGRLGIPAYLDLDGGVYKVRVGNFARREDADAALPGVRAQYYPDAWVVPPGSPLPRADGAGNSVDIAGKIPIMAVSTTGFSERE